MYLPGRRRRQGSKCSPHERSDMRGSTQTKAPDVASLIRATLALGRSLECNDVALARPFENSRPELPLKDDLSVVLRLAVDGRVKPGHDGLICRNSCENR